MRKFLFTSVAIILMAITLVGMAGADIFDMWQGTAYTDSPIVMNAGTTLTVPSITATTFTGTASEVKVGNIIDTAYGLKNSTAGNAQVNLTASGGLKFGAGSILGSVAVEPSDFIATRYGLMNSSDGIKVNLTTSAGLKFGAGANLGAIAVEPSDFISTSYGLLDSSDDIRINLTASEGLDFGTGASLGSLQVDATDIISTSHGLYEPSTNNLGVNLTEDGGLGFGTGANSGALIIYPADGMKTTSDGLEVNLSSKSGLAIGTGAEDGALKIGTSVFEMDIIGGGTVGNFTLTGAALGDELIGVTYFNGTTGNLTAVVDLTSEFSIPATNILNQTYGGSNTTSGYIQVLWMDRT